jgi:hypothetical protein
MYSKKTCPNASVHHKSHIIQAGIEPGPLHCKAGDWLSYSMSLQDMLQIIQVAVIYKLQSKGHENGWQAEIHVLVNLYM